MLSTQSQTIRPLAKSDISSVDFKSSIHSWLATVPGDTDYLPLSLDTTDSSAAAAFSTFEDKTEYAPNSFEDLQTAIATFPKRKRLEEISANIMQPESPLRKSKRQSQRHSHANPKGHTRASESGSPQRKRNDIAHEEEVEDEEFEATPRSDTSWRAAPKLSAYSTSSQSSTSSRSRSPARKLADFKHSNLPITPVNFGTPDFPTPKLVQSLFKDIRNIYEHGDEVVPSYFDKRVDFEEESIRQSQVFEYKEDGWTQNQFFDQVQWINEATRRCANRDLSEAAWNAEVHSSVLRLALRGKWESKGIYYDDVTTARIHHKNLLPTVFNIPMESKMVDYCLVLTKLQDQVQEKLKMLRDIAPTINHTNASYLRFNPIAVSIETKRSGEDEETANVQLGLWVCAHFTKLRQMIPEGIAIPPLVLVLVQGYSWRMMIADSPNEKGIVLFRYQEMGATDRVLGTCKLVASIQRIAQYVYMEYAEWFTEHVLGRK
jgi:hypothetical protein